MKKSKIAQAALLGLTAAMVSTPVVAEQPNNNEQNAHSNHERNRRFNHKAAEMDKSGTENGGDSIDKQHDEKSGNGSCGGGGSCGGSGGCGNK